MSIALTAGVVLGVLLFVAWLTRPKRDPAVLRDHDTYARRRAYVEYERRNPRE
jgi:hypothetical protein